MSGRVCYLARAGRTEGPALVRLVGSGTDESWQRPGAPDDAPTVVAHTALAADWTAQRAAQGDGPRHEVALLIVDVDGATCGWITAPSADSSVISAVVAQSGSDYSGGSGASAGTWAQPTESEASVQALAAPPEPPKGLVASRRAAPPQPSKLAFAAVPDVDARLFVDALDDRGVTVERAISLWHALALAWDPAAAAVPEGDPLVAVNAPATACVLIDPSGRLVWSWSGAGRLLAAGSIRLPRDRTDGGATVAPSKSEIARLTSDWLAWSVQIGSAPSRVICVGPRTGAEGSDALTPAALGAALTKSWPGATVDLAVHDDPIGATLRRLATLADGGPTDDGRRALVALSRRPGKAHRSLYRWTAVVLFGLALALLAVAWQCLGTAEKAKGKRERARSDMVDVVSKHAAPANDMQQQLLTDSPSAFLRDALNKRRAALNPSSGLDPAEPVLSELETLSLVLGIKEVEIEEISLLNSGAMVYASVADTRTGEDVKKSLDEIGTSHCDWVLQSMTPVGKGDRKRLTLYGKWKAAGGKP